MSAQSVIIVGAGLIGASVAYHLAKTGAKVRVLEAAQPASGASGHSFGWINASFFLDDAHHRLRVAGLDAWRRLHAAQPDLSVSWPGCLWWEEQGDGLEAMAARLHALNYPVERIDKERFSQMAPALGRGDLEALLFPQEGLGEPHKLTAELLDHAKALGAEVFLGCDVSGLELRGGRVVGVRSAHGAMSADNVIIAAGNGSASLLQGVDVHLPMLKRPGAIMRTRPVPPLLDRIMVSPELEFRQDASGRIIAPTSAAHQADNREELPDAPGALARDTLRRLQALMPGVDLELEEIAVAYRPVPGDGLPAVGACGPDGLYLAVMHSGVTLGALMGELVAADISGGGSSDLLAGYRPQRFQT